MRVDSEEKGDQCAERGDLGEGQVDEDHLALDDVDPQVGVDPHKHQALAERREHDE